MDYSTENANESLQSHCMIGRKDVIEEDLKNWSYTFLKENLQIWAILIHLLLSYQLL